MKWDAMASWRADIPPSGARVDRPGRQSWWSS
jgi:hypothetical protein